MRTHMTLYRSICHRHSPFTVPRRLVDKFHATNTFKVLYTLDWVLLHYWCFEKNWQWINLHLFNGHYLQKSWLYYDCIRRKRSMRGFAMVLTDAFTLFCMAFVRLTERQDSHLYLNSWNQAVFCFGTNRLSLMIFSVPSIRGALLRNNTLFQQKFCRSTLLKSKRCVDARQPDCPCHQPLRNKDMPDDDCSLLCTSLYPRSLILAVWSQLKIGLDADCEKPILRPLVSLFEHFLALLLFHYINVLKHAKRLQQP